MLLSTVQCTGQPPPHQWSNQTQMSVVPRVCQESLIQMFLSSLASSPPKTPQKNRDGTSEAQVSREQILFCNKDISLLDS